MKEITFSFIAILVLIFHVQIVKAQDTVNVDPTLNGQYHLLLSKSKTLDGFKLVNPYRLSSLWKNFRDTLANEHKQLTAANHKIATQEQNIKTLKSQMTNNENLLSASTAKSNEINFLGIPFTKSTYNLMVWAIIIALALALTFVIRRSATYIHEAKYRNNLYEEVSQEYQSHKIKAIDREKKLARELQDERNKLEELKNKGK